MHEHSAGAPSALRRAGAAESREATDALLAGLRRSRFTPSGWGRFAGATVARSGATAVAHPRAALEITALHLVLALLAGAGRRRWVAFSWLMAVTHLGMLGERRSVGLATTVTLVRANLPAVVRGSPEVVGLVSLVSDKADGILARRAGPTQFGHYADSLADAAFWSWFALRHEPDRRLVVAAAAAWLIPVAAVTAISVGGGRMVEAPRSVWARPAAALQSLLALRAARRAWQGLGPTPA